MAEKRFNDEEVSLILRRALDGDGGLGADVHGLTLRQLKEIAAEVGIDPAKVESAALAVQAEGAGVRGNRIRVTARYDIVVDGQIPAERRAEVLRRIRTAMGRHGIVTENAEELEWKARDFFGGRYITVRSEGDQTHVEALGNFRDGAVAGSGMVGTLGLAATAIALKTVGGVAALGAAGPAVLLAGAALPAWFAYRRWFRKEDRALRRAVADIAAQAGEERSSLPGQSDAEATLDAPDPAPGPPRGGSSPGDDGPPRP